MNEFLLKSILLALALRCKIEFWKGKNLEEVTSSLPLRFMSGGARAFVLTHAGVPIGKAKLISYLDVRLRKKLAATGKLDELLNFRPK